MTGDGMTIEHRVMGGVPCIEGTPIPIATVIGLLGQGLSFDEILAEYPTLNESGILAGLKFAVAAIDERELPLRPSD